MKYRDHGDQRPIFSITGGTQSEGAWHARGSLARLSLWEDSVEIGPSHPLLRFVVRTWISRYSELSEVQPINVVSASRQGIRFKKRDSIDWIIFGTSAITDITNVLRSKGVKVNAPIRKGFLTPGI
jgi:hypothetical protein